MGDDAAAVGVLRVGSRRSLTRPKILQPPKGSHGVAVKCAACSGAGVVDAFYKNALQFNDEQRNTSTDCCHSPAMCMFLSCGFVNGCWLFCPYCPGYSCCCEGCCDDSKLKLCIRGQLIPGKKVQCGVCLGEGYMRFDGNAKAHGEGLLALGRVKFYVMCPARKSSDRCHACGAPIPFGRGIELFQRTSDGASMCLACAEAAPAAEIALCERVSVHERAVRSEILRDRIRLFHEPALPSVDGYTYETDEVRERRDRWLAGVTLPNGAYKWHVGYQMRVGSFREEDFAAVGIEWHPPSHQGMERT